MPKQSSITVVLVEEVATRRAGGELWKIIAEDMRKRGLPVDRASWWRRGVRDVAQHRADCLPGTGGVRT